jgi:hypothetical protein
MRLSLVRVGKQRGCKSAWSETVRQMPSWCRIGAFGARMHRVDPSDVKKGRWAALQEVGSGTRNEGKATPPVLHVGREILHGMAPGQQAASKTAHWLRPCTCLVLAGIERLLRTGRVS